MRGDGVGDGAVLGESGRALKGETPGVVLEGDLGRGRSGVNRRGRGKRRGRNVAAEVKAAVSGRFDSQALEGKRPQERSLCGGSHLQWAGGGQAGRNAQSSEGEIKFKKGANWSRLSWRRE